MAPEDIPPQPDEHNDNENGSSNISQFRAKTKTGGKAPGGGSKPEIFFSDTTINEAARTAMYTLAVAKVPIYQRAGNLMRPASVDLIDADRKKVKAMSLIELNATYLKMILADHFTWWRAGRIENENGEKKAGWRRVSSGWDVPELILAMQGDWPFPPVTGILTAPTLRPNGSLLDRPGYDEQTGLLLTNLPTMPTVKEKPTREDAEAALKLLLKLLEEFPFLDDASRVVALSLILSMVARGALGQVPLHFFSAPVAGSGKSLFNDIVWMIVTGRRAPVVGATARIDEQEKRIAAAMLSGRALIALDNLTRPLDSALLCQAVSQPIVVYRKMGGDKEIEIDCRSTVCTANGNNITIIGDLGRRTLFARIDAKMERPWERDFKRDPLELIAADRGRYIAAALTIPLAYLAAGTPRTVNTPANGFEAWSRLVREALAWLGQPDVASTMEVARSEDPKLQEKLAVFTAMAGAFGVGEGAAKTSAQIIEASESLYPDHRALRTALLAIAPAGARDISSAALGAWMREAKDTGAGGMQLRGGWNKSTNTGTWWIEPIYPEG
jgi:putative DNA primase/helicase